MSQTFIAIRKAEQHCRFSQVESSLLFLYSLVFSAIDIVMTWYDLFSYFKAAIVLLTIVGAYNNKLRTTLERCHSVCTASNYRALNSFDIF